MKAKRPTERSRKGQHLVEAAVVCICLIPIALFLLDVTFIFLASNLNDAVCRDAARAAATAEPTLTQAGTVPLASSRPNYERAQSVVANAYTQQAKDKSYIEALILDPNQSKIRLRTVPNSPSGGSYQGTVTVITQVKVKLPVVVPPVTSPITLATEASFPLTAQRRANAQTLSP